MKKWSTGLFKIFPEARGKADNKHHRCVMCFLPGLRKKSIAFSSRIRNQNKENKELKEYIRISVRKLHEEVSCRSPVPLDVHRPFRLLEHRINDEKSLGSQWNIVQIDVKDRSNRSGKWMIYYLIALEKKIYRERGRVFTGLWRLRSFRGESDLVKESPL